MKKKMILMATSIVLLVVLGSILISAYTNGQKVTKEPEVLWVSHTEYWSSSGVGEDEVASTIVRITDYKGTPFDINSCVANIYYPDKSPYVSNGAMSESPVSGNWYRTDTVPTIEGTYEQEVICLYGAGKSIKTSQSFHVNPALNFIKNVSSEVLAADAYMHSANVSITGTVENAKAELSTQLTTTKANLTTLLNIIDFDLTSQIDSVEAHLDTDLTNVSVEIRGDIADTEAAIIARVDVAETNLTDLLNQVNSELQTQLSSNNATTTSLINDLDVSITGTINDAKAEIISQISATETTLTNLINTVDSDLSTQLTNAEASLDSKMTDVNISISTQIDETQSAIQTQLTTAETNLDGAVTAAKNELISYLENFLSDINSTVTDIYTDTQWLVTNAMNEDDYAIILGRFDTVDSDIDQLQAMCGSALTENSDLCTEIETLQITLDTLRSEQTAYFDELNSTTVSTWTLLSGSIATNIDTILSELGIIRDQTEDINATVHEIREDQVDRVYIQSIA